jgi:glutaredoxin
MVSTDITVYGAYWCPDCRRSKMFLVEPSNAQLAAKQLMRPKVKPKTKIINGARQGSQSVVMDQETVP